MNFNIDDPLAGILSDGSDDSFFDDDILGKNKSTIKATPASEKKKHLFNLEENLKDKSQSKITENKNSLFDLNKEDNKTTTNHTSQNLKTTSDLKIEKELVSTPTPFKRSLSKDSVQLHATSSIKSITNTDTRKISDRGQNSIDKLGDSNMRPKKDNLERGKSSQSILDDILGEPLKTASTSKPSIIVQNTATKNQEITLDELLGNNDTKPPTVTKFPGKQESTVTQKKEDKKEIKNKSDDWLGIFQNKQEDNEDEAGMPSWLLGNDNKNTKRKENKKKDEIQQPKDQDDKEKDVKEVVRPEQIKVENLHLDQIMNSAITSNIKNNSNEDITTESATLYLKEQESQLMVALQLKAQEEKLAALQCKMLHIPHTLHIIQLLS